MGTWSGPSAPSGEQLEICYREQRATIVEVGGGIRSYENGARQVLDAYPVGGICDGGHGAALIPWPNRVADGRYRFAAIEHQLALTEPERLCAIHGLLRWRPWRALEHDRGRVVVGTRLHPQPGYPFMLDVSIEYELGDAGLRVRTAAINVGDQACPFGCGQHPYLSPGAATIDGCLLELSATTHILADERGLPVGTESVDGRKFDFSAGVRIGDLVIDDAFTDLARDPAGRATVALTGADGITVELWADRHYGFLQLFSGDTLAPERRRRGLAVEPMTCPANALASGDSLLTLEPGESFAGEWGVGLR
jgi:aldose 1-epimerase